MYITKNGGDWQIGEGRLQSQWRETLIDGSKILVREEVAKILANRDRGGSSDIVLSYFFHPSKAWSMIHHGSVGYKFRIK